MLDSHHAQGFFIGFEQYDGFKNPLLRDGHLVA